MTTTSNKPDTPTPPIPTAEQLFAHIQGVQSIANPKRIVAIPAKDIAAAGFDPFKSIMARHAGELVYVISTESANVAINKALIDSSKDGGPMRWNLGGLSIAFGVDVSELEWE